MRFFGFFKRKQNPVAVAKKSTTEIAREVVAGKWGNGLTRRKKLEAAGYDYKAIQDKVNWLLDS